MKKVEILNLNNVLSKVKLNKLEKEVRDIVLANHIATFKLAKEISSHLEEIKLKSFEGLEAEIALLQKYRAEYPTATEEVKLQLLEKAANDCPNIIAAEQSANDFADKFLNEELEVELTKMTHSDFIEMCVASDIDITPTDIDKYEFLF